MIIRLFTALFLKELSCYIKKWTIINCPKMKIAIKFFRKKAEKTIYLEDCRIISKNSSKSLPTSIFFVYNSTKKSI